MNDNRVLKAQESSALDRWIHGCHAGGVRGLVLVLVSILST